VHRRSNDPQHLRERSVEAVGVCQRPGDGVLRGQTLVGAGEVGRALAHLGVELVTRLHERALGVAACGADADKDARNQREHDQVREVRDLQSEGVQRRLEEVVEREGGDHRREQRRPEAAEPRGSQDRQQQDDRGVEDGLQPEGEQCPRHDREQRADVSDGREAQRVAESLLSDVALHLRFLHSDW
jgi:hypothetical protein